MIKVTNPKTAIGIIIISLIIFVILNIATSRCSQRRNVEYRKIEYEMEIEKIVKQVRTTRGTTYIDFCDRSKYMTGFARNYEYKPYTFCNFVKIGDSFLKKPNSDTIIIKRSNIEYLFVLGQQLNKHIND